jgi:hypothetical protein
MRRPGSSGREDALSSSANGLHTMQAAWSAGAEAVTVAGGSIDSGAVVEQARQAAAAERAARRLGATVRGIRTARGMTVAELGKHTGYSVAQVSRLERGIVPLTDIAVLRRFACALEVPPKPSAWLPAMFPVSSSARLPGPVRS